MLSHLETEGQRKRSLQVPLKMPPNLNVSLSGKSAHTEEPSHIIEDSGMQQDQEFISGEIDKQPADKEVTKADCFGVDVDKDFKENMLIKLRLLIDAAGTKCCCWRRYALSSNANCKPIGVKGPSSGIKGIWRTLHKKKLFLYKRNLFLVLMESLSPQVASAAKLPILNPNEFDLWKLRIEQVIECVVQPLAPTTAEQRLARKNELKARGTLLMALPDKHQSKFDIHKDVKTLMEAIEKRFKGNKKTKKVQKTLLKQQYENFTCSSSKSLDHIHDRLQKLINLEEQSLDDLFNSLKIYEAEVKISSSSNTSTQNISFMYTSNTNNTNEPVSTAASVSIVPNVDTLSNVVIYSFFASQSTSPQLDNDDLKQIDADDLEEMDLKWKMAMLTVEYYNCHRKGHFARECRSPKDTRRNGAADPPRRNVPAEEEPTNYALMAFTSLSSSSDSELKDNALVVLRQNLEKVEQERDDLKLKLEKFQTSSKNLSQLLASQINDKTKLGYNTQVFTRSMFDYDDYFTSESGESLPPCPIYDRSSVKIVETSIPIANTKTAIPKPKSNQYARMTLANSQKHVVPTAVLTKSKLVPITVVRLVTAAVPKPHVTRPRQAQPVVTKPHTLSRRNINHSPSPKASTFPPKVTAAQASMVNDVQGKWVWKPKCPILDHVSRNTSNPQHALNDKGVVDRGCSRHIKGNMSYLSDFKELNGGCVAFCGNPKVMCDKNIDPSGDLTCLFARATLDESNLWHRRLGHINFKTMNKLVKCNLVRGLPTKLFENDHTCVACKKGKQHRASCKTKLVSSVSQPMQRLHMDLFGPTFVKSLNKKSYCLVVTDDYNSNKTAKDLWDALARHTLGLEYGEQDMKAAVLYDYETFKATEGELAYFDILFKSQDESRHSCRWFYHEDSVIVPRRVFTMG
nr:ribonuclease H-like domain-containing protein [Tanacetum cinerariifolium]